MSDLLKLFDKHNTDKGSRKHFYQEVYEPHFEKIRNRKDLRILEIGIWKGESTAALHEYFPNATIYGIDIFVRTNPEDLPILKADRVKWIKGDTMDPLIKTQCQKAWPNMKFDIIIDDGAHWPEANRLTFKHLAPLLKKEGKYFIEDIWPFDIMDFQDMNNPWVKKHPDRYNKADYAKFLNEIKFGYKSQLYDVRQKRQVRKGVTGKPEWVPDSTIMMIENDDTSST